MQQRRMHIGLINPHHESLVQTQCDEGHWQGAAVIVQRLQMQVMPTTASSALSYLHSSNKQLAAYILQEKPHIG